MGDFDKCVAQVRRYEGGNVDDRNDPGGRTSRGITQKTFDDYSDKHGYARSDVFLASDATINQVYRENYWSQAYCDDFDDGTALCIFDAAVNSGLAQAAKWVQRSVGVKVDGDFGLETRNAVKFFADQNALVNDICSRRLAMLHGLSTWGRYGKGWSARVKDVNVTAIAWNNSQAAPPMAAPAPTPKAPLDDLKPPVDQSVPTAVATVGSVGAVAASSIGGVGDAAKHAADQLSPLTTLVPHIGQICAGLTIVAVAAGLYISLRRVKHDAIVNATATAKIGSAK